jgi:REP element-mobilizing transposase RayT
MGQSLCQIIVHLVFSTKDRRPWLQAAIHKDLFAVLGQSLKQEGCTPIKIGGHDDHVHLCFALGKQICISELTGKIKTDSSKWMKPHEGPEFAWQVGYAAFSVGIHDKDKVVRYIENQVEHHARHDFKTELRDFLDRAEISYDEKYLWD